MADGRLIRALMNCHGLKAPGGLLDLDLGQENEPVLEMGGWDSVPKNALREEGACGSVPSLSSFHFTPILLLWRGDPGVTDRSLSPPAHSFILSQDGPQVSCGLRGDKGPRFPAHLVFSRTEHFFVKFPQNL